MNCEGLPSHSNYKPLSLPLSAVHQVETGALTCTCGPRSSTGKGSSVRLPSAGIIGATSGQEAA